MSIDEIVRYIAAMMLLCFVVGWAVLPSLERVITEGSVLQVAVVCSIMMAVVLIAISIVLLPTG